MNKKLFRNYLIVSFIIYLVLCFITEVIFKKKQGMEFFPATLLIMTSMKFWLNRLYVLGLFIIMVPVYLFVVNSPKKQARIRILITIVLVPSLIVTGILLIQDTIVRKFDAWDQFMLIFFMTFSTVLAYLWIAKPNLDFMDLFSKKENDEKR